MDKVTHAHLDPRVRTLARPPGAGPVRGRKSGSGGCGRPSFGTFVPAAAGDVRGRAADRPAPGIRTRRSLDEHPRRQQRFVTVVRLGRVDRFMHAALIGPEHGRDVLQFVSLCPEEASGFLLGPIQPGAALRTEIEFDPGFGVKEGSQGNLLSWLQAAVGILAQPPQVCPPFAGVGESPEGALATNELPPRPILVALTFETSAIPAYHRVIHKKCDDYTSCCFENSGYNKMWCQS